MTHQVVVHQAHLQVVQVIHQVHQILLGAEVVIVEGLVLSEVEEGTYFLAAQPIKMADLDGSPVRPVLIEK